jgi:hypothetical protein
LLIKPPLAIMKKLLLFTSIILFTFPKKSFTQSSLSPFGIYTEDEKNLKECSFDKEAEAIVLLDEAFSNYDEDYHLITTRRIRIKILNQRGIDRGNIKIPFYSKDKFEYITAIEGQTYTSDDNPSISYLNRKSVYTEKMDDRFSNIRFALPNVKVGSIIEYKYESVMKHYGGLQDWIFQSDIPILKSCYLLQMIPTAEFSYVVSKKNNYPIIITPKKDVGQVYFEMNEIPGLRFEPYMDASKDYLQKVEFQLSGYMNRFGDKQTVNKTWKDISLDLATEESIGGTSKKNLAVTDDLKMAIEKQPGAAGKIEVIYNYVKNSFTWNGMDSKFAPDGLKQTWEKSSGTSGEINLVLINLLQAFKLNAYPLLVAERDFGKVDPQIPLIDRFNKTVAYVVTDDNIYILDATQKFCPFGLTPYPLLNTYALVVNKKNDKLLDIGYNNATYNNNVTVKMKLEENGTISGTAEINSADYAKEFFTEKIKQDEKKYIEKYIEEPHQGLKLENLSYTNIDTDSGNLVQNLKFNDQLNESGGFLLFNYNLFTGLLSRNPFTTDDRFTNVNFGYPYRITVDETIELPAGSKTDDLPKSLILRTPEKDIVISRQITRTGNSLQVRLEFMQLITLIPAREYRGLKEFYRKMTDMLNEPVVIKVGN